MATDRVDECMDRLTRVSETGHQYVNEQIAHYNPSKAEDLGLPYRDIHKAADTIGGIYQELHMIIDDATAVPRASRTRHHTSHGSS